jgi:transcriptional regulator with XRE-family HTH domain
VTNLRLQFGQRLRQLRRQRDMTQEQLAELISVSVEFVSNMERGINAPSFDTLGRLAAALKTTVADLFLWSNQEGDK